MTHYQVGHKLLELATWQMGGGGGGVRNFMQEEKKSRSIHGGAATSFSIMGNA